MPSYTRNKKRDVRTFVAVNSSVFYGFNTKDLASIAGISTADLTTKLGHVFSDNSTALTGKILILGAQAPKPPRVSKKIPTAAVGTQQTVSTFCDKTKLGTAVSDKWNIIHRGRTVTARPASPRSGSQTAIAQLSDGSYYCFSMNKEDFTAYATALGLESAASITSQAERDKLISGTSYPRPGRAQIKLESGGSFQSFFSTAKAPDLGAAGFDVIEEEAVAFIL